MVELRTRQLVIIASALAAAILVALVVLLFSADASTDDRLARGDPRTTDHRLSPRRRVATESSITEGVVRPNTDASSAALAAESAPAAPDDGPPNVFLRVLGDDPELDGRAYVAIELIDAVEHSSVAPLSRGKFEAPKERTFAFSFPSGSLESFRTIAYRYESESKRALSRGVFDAATTALKVGNRGSLDLEIRPPRRHLVVGRVVGAEYAHLFAFPQSQPKFDRFLDDDAWETRIEEDLTFRAWVPSIEENIVLMACSQGRFGTRILRIDADVDVGAIEIEKSPTYAFCGTIDLGSIDMSHWQLCLRPEASSARVSAQRIWRDHAAKDIDLVRRQLIDAESKSGVGDNREFEFYDVPPGTYHLVVEQETFIAELDLPLWALGLRPRGQTHHPSIEKSSAVQVTIPSEPPSTPFVYRPSIAEIVFERPEPRSATDRSIFLVTALNETTTIRFDSDVSWENDEGRLLVPSNTPVSIDFIGNGAEPRHKAIVSPARGESIRIKASDFDSMERAPTSMINVRFSRTGGESVDDIEATLETAASDGSAFVELACVPSDSSAFRLIATERLRGKHRLFMRFVHFDRSAGFTMIRGEYWAMDSRMVDFGDGPVVEVTVDLVRPGAALIRAVSSDGLVLPATIRWKGGDHVVPTRGVWPANPLDLFDDEIPPLAPGRYAIDVTTPGHSPRSVEFTIKSGETTPVTVLMDS